MDVDPPCSPPYPSVPAAGGGFPQGYIQCNCDGRPCARRGKRFCRCGQQEFPVGKREGPGATESIEPPPAGTLAGRLDGRYKRSCDAAVLHHLDASSRRTYGTGWRAWVVYAKVNGFSPILVGLPADTPVRLLALYFAVHLRSSKFPRPGIPINSDHRGSVYNPCGGCAGDRRVHPERHRPPESTPHYATGGVREGR
jgi:hypothetical protein